jgi:hypothetical protein
MVHVPYRGQGPALTDLLGGQVQVLFATTPGTTDYIRTGQLRGIAVTTASRAEALPDLPTLSDFIPGFEASGWYGLGAPRRTPAPVIDKLNKEINAALADPQVKARFANQGGEPLAGPRQKIFRTLPITGKKYFVLYLRQPGFSGSGKKYFVPYRSQAKNISYSTSGSLVFPDHRQTIFRTLPITGKKYFVLYLRWLGEGNFLVHHIGGGPKQRTGGL